MIIYAIMLLAFCALVVATVYHYDEYKKNRQNNDLAMYHKLRAMAYGVLCIIFVIAFIANRDEFFSDKHKYCNRMKEEQSMQDSFRPIQDYGPLRTGRDYFNNLPITS